MAKLTVRDLNVRNKRVFVRVDYNVPMEEQAGQMVINDATRIKETLPTLDLLIDGGARIILAARLGRRSGARRGGSGRGHRHPGRPAAKDVLRAQAAPGSTPFSLSRQGTEETLARFCQGNG